MDQDQAQDEVTDLFGLMLQVACNYGNRMRLGEVKDDESWILIRRIFEIGFGAPLPDSPVELKQPLAISLAGQPLDRIS